MSRSFEVRLFNATGSALIKRSHMFFNSGICKTLLAVKSLPALQASGCIAATACHNIRSVLWREATYIGDGDDDSKTVRTSEIK